MTPKSENPVRLDPFQTIVNVHFGAPYITVELQLIFYGPGRYYFCSPDDGPYVGPGAQYNYWWTSLFLRGWKYGLENGLLFIDGMDVEEASPWSWDGLPTYAEETIAAKDAHAWNDIDSLDNPLVGEFVGFQAMLFTPLDEAINGYANSPIVTFQQWHPNWLHGPWCESGVEWKSIDNDGFRNADGDFLNYEDPLGHNHLVLEQSVDFSGFTVTNTETGKTYQAVAAQAAEFDDAHPHSRFSLMMKQVAT